MRSELSFLMELFLDDELPKPVKIKIKERIQEVEEGMLKPHNVVSRGTFQVQDPNISFLPTEAIQSPSMQRIMAKNPDLIPPTPVTPAAAMALQQRAEILKNRLSEKPEVGRTGPRKF